jgi:hypothetical protein
MICLQCQHATISGLYAVYKNSRSSAATYAQCYFVLVALDWRIACGNCGNPPPSFAWQNQERSAPSRATTRPALITSLRRGRVATASGTDAASTTTKSADPPTAMP